MAPAKVGKRELAQRARAIAPAKKSAKKQRKPKYMTVHLRKKKDILKDLEMPGLSNPRREILERELLYGQMVRLQRLNKRLREENRMLREDLGIDWFSAFEG